MLHSKVYLHNTPSFKKPVIVDLETVASQTLAAADNFPYNPSDWFNKSYSSPLDQLGGSCHTYSIIIIHSIEHDNGIGIIIKY